MEAPVPTGGTVRRWFTGLDRAEQVVIVLTAVAVLVAVVVVLVPFSTGDGIPCRAAIVHWVGGPGGPGAPAGLDAGATEPCASPARRRMLAAIVAAAIAPLTGWVGLSVVREQAGHRP